MTLKQAKAYLRSIGLTINRTQHGEYRVNYMNGSEATAVYETDILSAVDTGVAMARQGRSNPDPTPAQILRHALDAIWRSTSGFAKIDGDIRYVSEHGYTVWRVWTYDVWGNRREGYEINDRYDQGYIPVKGSSEKAILRALKDKGILKSGTRMTSLSFDGDNQFIQIESARDGYPLCGLEREA